MVNDFFYAQPVRIYYGAGEIGRLGEILRALGCARCVLVSTHSFAARAERMVAEIPELCASFSDIEENPQLRGVEEVVRLIRAHDADAVVGIGGGSTLDTAKFAAAAAPGGAEPAAYYEGKRPFPEKRLPVIAVPTTAGTGSEVTQVSVISRGGEKKTINDPAFMPRVAIVDPALTLTVPPRTTMNTGIDAMAHALEGYWSRNHDPISDLMAVESVRLVLENLETAYRDGGDMDARANLSLAALLGGLAFAVSKTAGSHACSYPLSEKYHLPHGEAVAFTLDSFVRINADARLEELCRRVGLRDTDELAERIAAFKALGGLRSRLGELGGGGDVDALARESAAHPLMANNPVPMDEAGLRGMFENLR